MRLKKKIISVNENGRIVALQETLWSSDSSWVWNEATVGGYCQLIRILTEIVTKLTLLPKGGSTYSGFV